MFRLERDGENFFDKVEIECDHFLREHRVILYSPAHGSVRIRSQPSLVDREVLGQSLVDPSLCDATFAVCAPAFKEVWRLCDDDRKKYIES